MKAQLRNYRQSPRKVRLVTDSIKGKTVAEAIHFLSFLPKRAALPIQKLVSSAVANAKNVDSSTLIVKDIKVDSGTTLKRMMPRARGSAFQIKKRTSHVSLVLSEKSSEKKKNS